MTENIPTPALLTLPDCDGDRDTLTLLPRPGGQVRVQVGDVEEDTYRAVHLSAADAARLADALAPARETMRAQLIAAAVETLPENVFDWSFSDYATGICDLIAAATGDKSGNRKTHVWEEINARRAEIARTKRAEEIAAETLAIHDVDTARELSGTPELLDLLKTAALRGMTEGGDK